MRFMQSSQTLDSSQLQDRDTEMLQKSDFTELPSSLSRQGESDSPCQSSRDAYCKVDIENTVIGCKKIVILGHSYIQCAVQRAAVMMDGKDLGLRRLGGQLVGLGLKHSTRPYFKRESNFEAIPERCEQGKMNTTILSPDQFVLFDFPGFQGWISIPFCIIYIITLLGNVIILIIISSEERLQEPMHIFICMLGVADLALSSSVLPRIIIMLWFDINNISREGCFIQLFCIFFSAIVASSFLVAMSFDRYFAICYPLRYSAIFSNSTLKKTAMLCITRSLIFVTPMPVLASSVSYCRSNNLVTSYCDYESLIEISCTKSVLHSVYGLVIAFIGITDVFFIILTYTMILVNVLKLASVKNGTKALSTCSSHLIVVLLTYTTSTFAAVMHRYTQDISDTLLATLSCLYIILPGMLNPIIYGMRTKEIKKHALKHFKLNKGR
ncbi:olfactory receptor 52K1-like [Protopterus annectens]|uniref:olfactory receptor 52K1-like n=1 Tax=Protopterus annectens TaxID=7888 RepID=UPI001CF9824C|nr:olfactory receptor 52K1-like [Protopterus annectens]